VKPAGAGQDGAERKLVDGFAWFPDKVTFVAGGRHVASAAPDKDNPLRDFLKANMPPREMEEMYKFAEQVGNLRVDSLAFGYAADPQQARKSRIYFRITGEGDHKRLAEFLRKSIAANINLKEDKGPAGERITIFNMGGGFGPAMALVGDTDFLIAGYEDHQQANHAEVIEEILKIRAGGQANVFKGPLAPTLKTIAPETVGLVLGEVPQELRQGLLLGPAFQAMPDRIQMDVTPGSKGVMDLRFHGKFGNATQVKVFADGIAALRKQGIEALKNPPPLPPGAKIPPRTFALLRTSLEGLKIDAKGDAVTGGLQVSRELISVLPMMLAGLAPVRPPEMPMPKQAVPKEVPAQAK